MVDGSILDDDKLVISSIRRIYVDRKRMYYVREFESGSTRITTVCVSKSFDPHLQ